MNVSLRKRLLVWLSATITTAAAVAACLSFALSYKEANESQDDQLEQVALLVGHGDIPEAALEYTPRNHEEVETHYVIKRLGPLPPRPDPEADLSLPESLRPGLQTLDEHGVRWRAMVSEGPAGQRFAVAQRMTVREEVARDTALLTLLPLVVLMPVLVLILSAVLARAFAPVHAMSAEVDGLNSGQLAPLDERHVPLETLPLVRAVNRLMHRLGLALEQQRRLVSDAAHELRTPVAALILQADNVQHVELPTEGRVRMAALRHGLTRMASLIDQLLSFARVQGMAVPAPQRLDFTALVRSAIEDTLPLAQAKGVDLGCLRLQSVAIRGDALQAGALVRNAIDNAVRYTPPGGCVDVTVSADADTVCFVIQDTGPGIADADRERVFEPFVRVLGNQESGSGLGLAIARLASTGLGGRIELTGRDDGGTGLRFVYRQAAA